MKKLLALLVLIVAGVLVYQHFAKEPTPTERRSNAQTAAHKVVEYWLDAIKDKRENDMVSVCHDAARLQSKAAIDALRREEDRLGKQCGATSRAASGTPGAFRATLSAEDATLMQLTVRAGERDGKYWVIGVAVE